MPVRAVLLAVVLCGRGGGAGAGGAEGDLGPEHAARRRARRSRSTRTLASTCSSSSSSGAGSRTAGPRTRATPPTRPMPGRRRWTSPTRARARTTSSSRCSCAGRPPGPTAARTANWAPDKLRDYADFLVAAARRYKRVRLWMIWGEPSRAAPVLAAAAQLARGPAPVRAAAGPRLRRAQEGAPHEHGDRRHDLPRPATSCAREFMRWMRLPNGKPPRLDWFGHNPFTARRPTLRKRPIAPGVRDMSDVDTYIKEIRRHWKPRHIKPKLWLSEFCVASDRPNRAFYVPRDPRGAGGLAHAGVPDRPPPPLHRRLRVVEPPRRRGRRRASPAACWTATACRSPPTSPTSARADGRRARACPPSPDRVRAVVAARR